MTVFGAIVVYVMAWWLVFFMALPFGVRRNEDDVAGVDQGAPAKTYLWQKLLITTVVAALLTYGVDWVVRAEMIQLRDNPL